MNLFVWSLTIMHNEINQLSEIINAKIYKNNGGIDYGNLIENAYNTFVWIFTPKACLYYLEIKKL